MNPDPKTLVEVTIPATTANLGPGFDCLGIALQVYNKIKVWRSIDDVDEEAELDVSAQAMGHAAAKLFFKRAKQDPIQFGWSISGDVPISRGLGSSVTLRLGILAGLDSLLGNPLKKEIILSLATQLEGHPDNAAAALYGGFTVALAAQTTDQQTSDPKSDRITCLRFPIDEELKFVLLIPNFEIKTDQARAILPAEVDRKKAVRSAARSAFIAAAFASKQYSKLTNLFSDEAFHEPYRASLIPFLPKVISGSLESGGLGGFLSGSGSTITCLTQRDSSDLVRAIEKIADQEIGSGNYKIISTTADNRGTFIPGEP